SIIGSLIGVCIGFTVIPIVVYNAYRIMYVVPDLVITFRVNYALGCTAVAVAVTGLAALSACAVELREVPAQLLRPKPPKTGKRILLERIGIIWNRLSFLQKVSARNIFRYKKRIYMTIIGVAGCTALMFAGFGLRYAISSIVDKQYESIFIYDIIGMNKDNLTKLEMDEIRTQFEKDEDVEGFALVRQQTFSFEHGSNKTDADILVPESMEDFDKYIVFRERKSQKTLELDGDNAIITEKLSKLLDADVGDTIKMVTDTGREIDITVGGITENYVSHYVYLTKDTYENLTGDSLVTNAFLMELGEDIDKDAFATRLLDNNNILGFGFSEESGNKFRELVGSLNYIVIVIIVAAGALAFVVLYNLANINVEERIREIATIKVLGFYDNEVSSYVSRESFISSFMGMVAGLLLGVPFLRFIVATAEVDMAMFNPAIRWDTYLWAGVLTMVFTLVVDRAMYKRLKKVDMVSSLKSVE
ncbi:MAG: ABC transporter permease, partial [Clostridia bacterium]|nr:ABC transporter permease [Clostridia bacterium]